MNKRLFLAMAAVIGLGFSLAGCAALVVGAAVGTAAVFLEGDLEGYLATDIHGAVDATLAAADDLKLTAVSKTGDVYRATMVAQNPAGQKVTIKLHSESPAVTEVKIRIGVTGNEAESRRVLNAIERRVRKS